MLQDGASAWWAGGSQAPDAFRTLRPCAEAVLCPGLALPLLTSKPPSPTSLMVPAKVEGGSLAPSVAVLMECLGLWLLCLDLWILRYFSSEKRLAPASQSFGF